MASNPYVNKVQTADGTVLIDLSQDTVTSASDIVSGKVGHLADGSQVTGTASGGGGGSSWTKVAETTYQVTTSSTAGETVATWATGHPELWTGNSYVFVRIRDTAGKRVKYYYGSDCIFVNNGAANGITTGTLENVIGRTYACDANGNYTTRYIYDTTGHGIFPNQLDQDGNIRIRARYNGTYSRTIDGTYKVEVYLLAPPTGSSIFA